MKSVRLNNLSLKYQICSPLGCKDIGIRKLAFVAKTQFLLNPQQIPRSELIFKIPPPPPPLSNFVMTTFQIFSVQNKVQIYECSSSPKSSSIFLIRRRTEPDTPPPLLYSEDLVNSTKNYLNSTKRYFLSIYEFLFSNM